MNGRTYATVGVVAVVLLGAMAVVSAGGVPFSGDGTPTDTTETPDSANATTIDHGGEHLSLRGASGQTVSGETDLAPGTELSIRVLSDDAANPFIVQQTTTVADGGTFAATVDLADVSEDASAWATVVHDDAEVANVSARVTAVEGATGTDAHDGSTESANGTAFVFDGERLTLAALENETVRGETALDPGTDLTVRLTGSGSSPFLLQETATVTDDGTFAATVDLVGVDNGTEFTATVRHDDEAVAEAEGLVVGGKNDVSSTNESAGNWTAVSQNETERDTDSAFNTTLDYDGEALTLDSAPNQTVGGETELATGSNVTVRLTSTGADPFLRSATATVTEDGRFETEFNTSTVASGTPFEVTVHHDGDRLTTADGEVVE